MKINYDLLQAEIYRLNALINLLDFLRSMIEADEMSQEQAISDLVDIINKSCLEEQFIYRK